MSDCKAELIANLGCIEERLAAGLARAGRVRSEVTLVAVSKKQPVERVVAYQNICHASKAVPVFGENYVQEFQKKQSALSKPYQVHLIGPLQSNKVRLAVSLFDVIESVHSVEIAKALHREAEKQGKILDVFAQVNISDDPSKSGFSVPEACALFEEAHSVYPALRLRGLMTITREYEKKEDVRPDFVALRELRNKLGDPTLKLSMGMSSDFDIAVEEGADIVRVGTAIFGSRGS